MTCSLKNVAANVFYYGGTPEMTRMKDIPPPFYPGRCARRCCAGGAPPPESDAAKAEAWSKRVLQKQTLMKRDTGEDGKSYAENTFDVTWITCDGSCVRKKTAAGSLGVRLAG